MLGNPELNSVWVFEEDLNRLKWWTLGTPLKKPVRGDWQTIHARARSPRQAAGEGVARTDGRCGRRPLSSPSAAFCISIASTTRTVLARAGLQNRCPLKVLHGIAGQSDFWGAS